jgi:hypothetical protein
MPSQPRRFPYDRGVVVETRGPDEWIVSARVSGRALHVYRLTTEDWLVSEVGRDSEGRGSDLRRALVAMSDGGTTEGWWELVVDALDAKAGAP